MGDPNKARAGKRRSCCVCGEDMGFIENRFYRREDTCGKRECEREIHDAIEAEREEAHREVDNYYDQGW